MKLYTDREKEIERVRVIIGSAKIGSSGIQSPSKSILLIETNVDEVYDFILSQIKKFSKKGGKNGINTKTGI